MSAAPAELAALAARFGLDAREQALVRALVAVEVDGRGSGEPAGWPTVAALADGGRPDELVALLAPGGRLTEHALIELGSGGPFLRRPVRLPDAVWLRLLGVAVPPLFAVAAATDDGLTRLPLAPTTRAQLERIVDHGRRADQPPLVVIVGASERDPVAVAVAVTGALGWPALLTEAAVVDDDGRRAELRRELVWAGAAAVITGPPRGDRLDALLTGLAAPVVVVLEPTQALDVRVGQERWRADVRVDELPFDQRRRCWAAHLHGASLAPTVDLDVIAAHWRFGPSRIGAIAALARQAAALADGVVGLAELRRAARVGASATSALLERLDGERRLDELVVGPATRRELALARLWARHGAAALAGPAAGPALRGSGGLVCLFHGPPGTGKTLAARALAGELGLEVLRVDLSQVVNKYIGETEKHLAQVFAEADAAGDVLFFDEADALFGRRSEVKDAHDRYANIETSFLLQRLESYRGLCVLATNLRDNLDEAFTRRIHLVVEFRAPDAAERVEIWRRHVRVERLASDVDLPELGRRFALAGGDIRNAAMTALLLAAGDDGDVAMRHLVVGAWRELRKGGRLVTPDDAGPWRDAIVTYERG
jgi:hypothetical protein